MSGNLAISPIVPASSILGRISYELYLNPSSKAKSLPQVALDRTMASLFLGYVLLYSSPALGPSALPPSSSNTRGLCSLGEFHDQYSYPHSWISPKPTSSQSLSSHHSRLWAYPSIRERLRLGSSSRRLWHFTSGDHLVDHYRHTGL